VKEDNLKGRLKRRPPVAVLGGLLLASALLPFFGEQILETALSSQEASSVLSADHVQWVVEDGFPLWVTTEPGTVGDGLASLGVHLEVGDMVYPPPYWPLSPGLHVVVVRAKDVELVVGGQSRRLRTQATTVEQLLAEQWLSLGPFDEVTPPLDTPLRDEAVVRITRVLVARETVEEVVPHPIEYRHDPTLPSGQSYVAAQGRDGLRRHHYDVVYKDGRLWERRPVGEEMIAPQPTIIVRGVGLARATTDECAGIPYKQALTVWATWYQPGEGGAGYTTATGLPVRKGIVAVDPAVIPLGTRLCIPGYGMALAADTGGAVRGYVIDLAYPEDVIPDWRTGYVTIYILE